ncbi:hypothetical protein XENTR_v10019569 [Xenopus tropicalis]|uniref:Uncharacterized protein LOC100487732 n=1 Tax=Xenopus tropicalis TaxID=8364 RepID=A0A8J1JVU3_XENTR|nr:uncharacterized protein LOC100487732 [Xenopus tropicalis]KAE8594306.1 hypothetical protein XENTR_v10019569 [Xenopus tropicalis]
MNPSRPSEELSYKLRLAVALLISGSNLFLLIALVSDYWINARNGLLYLGLWKGCNADVCVSQTGLVYAKVALITCFILALVFNAVTVLHFKYDFSTIPNFKRRIGWGMMAIGLFEFYGMAHGTAFLVVSPIFESVSWALILGWIAVVLAFAAGGVSYYHARREPEIPEPTTAPTSATNPVFITTEKDPPPSSIIVS